MSLRDRVRAIFSGVTSERLFAVPVGDSLGFAPTQQAPEDEHWQVESPLAVHALNELTASGLATEDAGGFCIRWDDLYAVLGDVERAAALV